MKRSTTLGRMAGPATRRRVLVRAGGAVVAVATVSTLAACGGSSGGSGGGSSTDDVTIGVDSDAAANGYDPLLYGSAQFSFFAGLYDALFVSDADGKVSPSLVTSAENSADNTQTTLKLKDGVTFSDGSTLDATLVKQNLDRRSDATLAAYGQLAGSIKDVAAPDAQTVVITWNTPQADPGTALADEAGVIIGSKGVSDPASLKTTPDGSGPYTLDTGSTTRGSTYTLTKNDKAWNADAFAYDQITFRIITDDQALANAVVSGQVDVAGQLDPTTVDTVKSRKSVTDVGGTIFGFPVLDKTGKTNPAFAKPEVRLALNYATDRDALVKLHPGAKATAQLFPAAATGYDASINDRYAYDPAKAKQLLAQAGYADGFTIDQTVVGQPSDDQIAVQKQWAEVGVKLNFINATSTDAVFAAAQTQPLAFNPTGFTVGTNPAGFVAGVLYGGFMNLQKATDPAIESALGGALGGSGSAKDDALGKLNAAVTDEGWYVPLYESFISYGYDESKVAEPAISPTYGYVVLASVKPAS
ncbi:ABC transporter substrate-binding protein [Modestobacter sp. NPDC049651]|uniref:ABC transporter substrate-binding protein n=1 Tax=unclassified Modestobacter TaxID=2643866 RepID=UPI0033DF1CFB